MLSIPREYVSIGDVYLYEGKEASVYGNLTDLLEPSFDLPQIRTGEVMADIYGKISKAMSLSFGMKFLTGFLKVFGASIMMRGFKTGSKYYTNLKKIRLYYMKKYLRKGRFFK